MTGMAMRYLFVLLVLPTVLSWNSVVRAQVPRVQIDHVQVGFPAQAEPGEPMDPRNRVSLHKAGFWTPVYVSFTAGPQGVKTGQVTVACADTDDVENTYTVPLPTG